VILQEKLILKSLTGNQIGDEGILAIAGMLEVNRAIRKLNLESTDIVPLLKFFLQMRKEKRERKIEKKNDPAEKGAVTWSSLKRRGCVEIEIKKTHENIPSNQQNKSHFSSFMREDWKNAKRRSKKRT
jgi:hypothetical protein